MELVKITKNKLLINSLNLMFATGISAAFGFLFWIIVAHSFKTEVVGLATSLLSVASLLSLLGLAGFDTVFVRFLDKSKDRNAQINSGLIIAGIVTAIIATIFCLLTPILSAKLEFVTKNFSYMLMFVAVTVFMTWNTLTNAVLVAYRRTSFVLAINITFSILKVILPFIFISGGPMTIFLIVGISQVINVLLSIAVLMKYFNFTPSFKVDFEIVKETLKYGTTVYIANILNLLPDSVLPIIVINYLGATEAAYFYISFSIANLLYTIAFSTNQVLLAETSHDEVNYIKHAFNGLKIISSILTPAIVLIFILSPFILNLFGKNYIGALEILRIMCLSGFAVMFYSFLNFVFKQTKNLKGMFTITSVNALSIIILSLIFVKIYGLVGIGWAWLMGTCIAVISSSLLLSPNKYLIKSNISLLLNKSNI